MLSIQLGFPPLRIFPSFVPTATVWRFLSCVDVRLSMGPLPHCPTWVGPTLPRPSFFPNFFPSFSASMNLCYLPTWCSLFLSTSKKFFPSRTFFLFCPCLSFSTPPPLFLQLFEIQRAPPPPFPPQTAGPHVLQSFYPPSFFTLAPAVFLFDFLLSLCSRFPFFNSLVKGCSEPLPPGAVHPPLLPLHPPDEVSLSLLSNQILQLSTQLKPP